MGRAAIALLMMLGMAMPVERDSFKVVGEQGGEVIVQPYAATLFGFKLVAGKLPEDGVLNCSQATETMQHGDWSYPTVVLNCQNGLKLKLSSVDLMH